MATPAGVANLHHGLGLVAVSRCATAGQHRGCRGAPFTHCRVYAKNGAANSVQPAFAAVHDRDRRLHFAGALHLASSSRAYGFWNIRSTTGESGKGSRAGAAGGVTGLKGQQRRRRAGNRSSVGQKVDPRSAQEWARREGNIDHTTAPGRRVHGTEVQGLFDRRRVFELDAWRHEHRDDGRRHRHPVDLVAAAKDPFGFQQRAQRDEEWLAAGGVGIVTWPLMDMVVGSDILNSKFTICFIEN